MRPRKGKRTLLIVIVAAILAGLFTAIVSRTTDSAPRRALSAGPSSPSTPPAPRFPAAALATALRELKLVTVRIDHSVTALAADESWRGNVSATVTGNATTLFGVDLSKLEVVSSLGGPLGGEVSVRVPRPVRIATEITSPADDLGGDVRVGWGRFRGVSGEYYLGLARARLHEAAREQMLSKEQRERVEKMSLEQVEKLVRAVVGEDVDVRVDFEDRQSAPLLLAAPDGAEE